MAKTEPILAKDIIALAKLKVPKTEIARKYKVNRMTVARILENPNKYLRLDK